MQHNYEINELNDYKVKGNINGTGNIILNNNDEIMASIISKKDSNGWYKLGDTEAILNNCQNNINII